MATPNLHYPRTDLGRAWQCLCGLCVVAVAVVWCNVAEPWIK